ncbi:hypothetical protein EXM85_03145 [Clostridium botulinum]|uniref:hypothetical protein n=2 Tax=Clostridium botulinum TaxID=1491 RepID=UPI0005A51ED5|nr:hypothetical protein [Clostridium botulinum]NFB97057.1 hypothetical protein [Clostridium botulinum]NFC45777.1 hypothetical protein [Clostridium botulinum]NFC82620.1 hypothetical protein [Clostridium botulinum]NFD50608.1 hypothetical protein [Clostridium botulinum]NFE86350.1 hypothetical protein [Clostridium botulinum]
MLHNKLLLQNITWKGLGNHMKKKSIKILIVGLVSFTLISFSTVTTFAANLSDIICSYSPKAVHITNDYNLKDYLSNSSKNSLNIADYAKSNYVLKYSEPIDVTRTSMAIEIIGHVYPDKIAKYLPFGLGNIITKHTSIIDIGEKSVDSNRWIWDSIAAVIGDNFDNSKRANSRSVNSLMLKMNTEQHVDEIIKNPKNKNLKLNKYIMIKVQKDIDNNTIDPILLKAIEN